MPPVWSPVDGMNLAWNPAVLPSAGRRRPPRLRGAPGEGGAETRICKGMPDWLRWITSCQPPLSQGDCRVLPEQQKSERAIQRGWIKGATTAGRRATFAPVREESHQLPDHRVADKKADN